VCFVYLSGGADSPEPCTLTSLPRFAPEISLAVSRINHRLSPTQSLGPTHPAPFASAPPPSLASSRNRRTVRPKIPLQIRSQSVRIPPNQPPTRWPRTVRAHPLIAAPGGPAIQTMSAAPAPSPPNQTGRTPCPPPAQPSPHPHSFKPLRPPSEFHPSRATKSIDSLQLHTSYSHPAPDHAPASSRMFHNVPPTHPRRTNPRANLAHPPLFSPWLRGFLAPWRLPTSTTPNPAKPRQSAPNHPNTQNAQNDPKPPRPPPATPPPPPKPAPPAYK
jgi:hypothetical protein